MTSDAVSLRDGRATLTIPAGTKPDTSIELELTGSAVFVRAVTLNYGQSGGRPIENSLDLQRVANSGERVTDIPMSQDGRPLRTITVTTSPGSNASVRMSIAPAQGGPGTASNGSLQPARLPGTIIASTTMAPAADRADIEIGRNKGPLTELIVSVRGGKIDVTSVELGRYSEETLRIDAAGTSLSSTSAPLFIRLKSPEEIRSLRLIGQPDKSGSTSIIEVRAVTSEKWAGQFGENRITGGGWVLIGTASVIASPHKPQDRTALRLRAPAGPIKRLRLKSQRQTIPMNGIDLLLANGQRQTLPAILIVPTDEPSAAIAVPPEAANIVAIELRPRITRNSRIDTAIEVWGQY